MQKIIHKSTALKAIITIISLCLIITIFPLRIWSQTISDTIPRTSNEKTGLVTQEKMVLQTFIAGYDYLGSIRIFLAGGSSGDSFYFRMLDHERKQMFEEIVTVNPDNLPGYYEILVDQAMELGETYYYIIQAENEHTSLYLGAEWILREEHPNAGQLYYQDNPMSGQSLAVAYHYIAPLNKVHSLMLIAALLVFLYLSTMLVYKYFRKYPEKDTLLIVEQIVKVLLNPLVFIFVVIGLVAVCFKTFGPYLFDNIFFAVAILLGGGICWYGINHRRDGQTAKITKTSIQKNWPDYLQSAFFAVAFYACCEYMCALESLHHTIGQNKQIIFFGLAMMTMMSFKPIFSLVNLLYLTIAGGLWYYWYYYWYKEQILVGMGELTELEMTGIRLTMWAGIIGGMVIINVIVNVIARLIKKEMKPISVSFGCLILLFLSLMVVFRNTREWPVVLAVSFTLFYLQYGASKRGDIVLNICRGLILSFIWMMGYSLLYRPFATFQTVRYPLLFHTVTVTATYLALVATAALIILLSKMRNTHQLRDLWKECVLLGTVLTYLVFTVSNTGIYAFLVAAVFSILMFTASKGRQRIKNMITAAGLVVMSIIICFPVVFFLQRNIPALVGKPKIYYLESFHQDITRGRNLASYEHMRVGRFIEVFLEEFLGFPGDYFDFYGHIKAHDEQHVVMKGSVYTLEEAEEMGVQDFKTVAEVKQELLAAPKIEALESIEAPESAEPAESMEASEPIGGSEPINEEERAFWLERLNVSKKTESEFGNGRMDIFRAYINELNPMGHDYMGATFPDGTIIVHAHNIYLQFAFDHGIYMGILFIIVGGVAFVRGMVYYRKNKDTEKYAALPAAIIVVVATVGLAEWVFHFSNPSGFMLLLMMAPLIFGERKIKQN